MENKKRMTKEEIISELRKQNKALRLYLMSDKINYLTINNFSISFKEIGSIEISNINIKIHSKENKPLAMIMTEDIISIGEFDETEINKIYNGYNIEMELKEQVLKALKSMEGDERNEIL